MDRFDAQVLAYCPMDNHYHLALHTRQANLSRLMRQINGVYTQAFNRRHGILGHMFQGRFKAYGLWVVVNSNCQFVGRCRRVQATCRKWKNLTEILPLLLSMQGRGVTRRCWRAFTRDRYNQLWNHLAH